MFDTEKFISEIEQRPSVYAVTSKEYSNKRLKAQSWNEIGEIMVKNWNELTEKEKDEKAKDLMKKWKAIRDNFVRELRIQKKYDPGVAVKRRRTYIHYDQLSFLTPYVQSNERTSRTSTAGSIIYDANENNTQQSTETENTDYESPAQTSTTAHRSERQIRRHQNKATFKTAAVARSIASTTKTLTSVLSESVKLQREEKTDKFGNRAFLLSYLPIMDNLKVNLQMHARCKISEMFNEFTFSYVND